MISFDGQGKSVQMFYSPASFKNNRRFATALKKIDEALAFPATQHVRIGDSAEEKRDGVVASVKFASWKERGTGDAFVVLHMLNNYSELRRFIGSGSEAGCTGFACLSEGIAESGRGPGPISFKYDKWLSVASSTSSHCSFPDSIS